MFLTWLHELFVKLKGNYVAAKQDESKWSKPPSRFVLEWNESISP